MPPPSRSSIGSPPSSDRPAPNRIRSLLCSMPHAISLTLACGDYDIVRALTDGSVEPEGIDLTIVTRMTASTRHWRFLRNREFDIAELSSSSYLIARDTGLAFDAIPVFLHRRFRHGFVFVNT